MGIKLHSVTSRASYYEYYYCNSVSNSCHTWASLGWVGWFKRFVIMLLGDTKHILWIYPHFDIFSWKLIICQIYLPSIHLRGHSWSRKSFLLFLLHGFAIELGKAKNLPVCLWILEFLAIYRWRGRGKLLLSKEIGRHSFSLFIRHGFEFDKWLSEEWFRFPYKLIIKFNLKLTLLFNYRPVLLTTKTGGAGWGDEERVALLPWNTVKGMGNR